MDLPEGYTHIHLDRVGSTNDEARAFLLGGAAADRVVLMAKEQTGGKGRNGRTWVSPEGNLYATLILEPARDRLDWPQICFVISLALAETLESILPPHKHVEVKWPNDVLVNNQKVSGVLLETTETPLGKPALLCGFGVNCRYFPENPLYPSTSLQKEGARAADITPERVMALFLQKFEPLYQNWLAMGLINIRPAWLSRARNHGDEINIRVSDYLDDGGKLTGTFVDIDEETGALLLKQNDGALHRITQGDVFFPDSVSEGNR